MEDNSLLARAEAIAQRIEDGYTELDSYLDGVADLLSELKAAGIFKQPDWEYGHEATSFSGKPREPLTTNRTPAKWINGMGKPLRRRRAVAAGPWEDAPDEVIIELDAKPWLKPGADLDAWPAQNRSTHNGGGLEFRPRKGYEQSIEKYGFIYADCGQSAEHFAHGNGAIAYCNGSLRQKTEDQE